MLLTVDIGNTHIIIGGFQIKDEIRCANAFIYRSFLTEHRKTDDQYAMAISSCYPCIILREHSIQDVIICSVVPELSDTMETSIYKSNRHYTYVIGSRNQNRAKYQN